MQIRSLSAGNWREYFTVVASELSAENPRVGAILSLATIQISSLD